MDKKKKERETVEKHMQDGKEYFDDHLNTNQLILRNLHDEAKDTVKEIKKISKEMQKKVETHKKSKLKYERDAETVSKLKKISYNLRSELEQYVEKFVEESGIKQLMYIIEDSQDLKDYEMIESVCKILHITFMYECGVDSITKNARKYFEKFFELSSINQYIKKQTIRIFCNITNNMPDCFDKIDKAASNYARDANKKMYEQLIDCLNYNDNAMTIGFLKWANNMVYKAADEKK